MTIAITCSTGHLGRLILQQLLDRHRPEQLILSVRQPQRAPACGIPNDNIRYGDFDVPESLEPSFRGANKLMMISSPCMDDTVRLQQHLAVIQAARRAGIQHIVYTSIFSPEKGTLPLHKLHLQTEQAIFESGMPYTILRNAYYTDIVQFLGIREAAASGVLVSPPGHWVFNTASRLDLAEAAAVVLTEEGHESQTYELTPTKTWNLQDLTQAIAENAGRHIVHRTDKEHRNDIYRMLPHSDMHAVSEDLARLVKWPLRSVKDEIRDLFGKM